MKSLLIVTVVLEAGAGIGLLAMPSMVERSHEVPEVSRRRQPGRKAT
jgi:hypothetical protein